MRGPWPEGEFHVRTQGSLRTTQDQGPARSCSDRFGRALRRIHAGAGRPVHRTGGRACRIGDARPPRRRARHARLADGAYRPGRPGLRRRQMGEPDAGAAARRLDADPRLGPAAQPPARPGDRDDPGASGRAARGDRHRLFGALSQLGADLSAYRGQRTAPDDLPGAQHRQCRGVWPLCRLHDPGGGDPDDESGRSNRRARLCGENPRPQGGDDRFGRAADPVDPPQAPRTLQRGLPLRRVRDRQPL